MIFKHALFGGSTQKPHRTFCGTFDELFDKECTKSDGENKGTACEEFFQLCWLYPVCLAVSCLLAIVLIGCVTRLRAGDDNREPRQDNGTPQ